MQIVSILDQKCRSYKITTVVNFRSTLAEQRQKSFLIDLNPQRSDSIWLGFKNTLKGLFELFTENVSILDIVCKTYVNGLYFKLK